ncbi:hypothetical protein [Acinetobacter piscicola]|uniref:hypothetical protein n=1 Tax=Acinetobacter piscicola TaxID=2006115 RepID=UPI000B7C6A66|nr:hypothetical protein [Acinetobacter piscicola]
MKNKILLSISCIFFSTLVNAKSLELRPLLKDRFERNCAVRQAYDFHDKNTEVIEPLASYIVDSKYIEQQAYDLTSYQLKNTFYAGIPISKIEVGFGRPAQQYNEYLYFDLTTATAKKDFKLLKFKQNYKNGAIGVEYKKNTAIVHCYWLSDYS